MSGKKPWTPSRVISIVLAVLFWIITVYGISLATGGSSLAHSPDDSSGLSGLFGDGLELFGTAIMIIGGVLAILFTSLYFSTTRRLGRGQTAAAQAKVKK